MNSMAWRSPTTPLPSETNPRFVFERMFGVGATAEERLARVQRRSQHPRWAHPGNLAPAHEARRARPHQAGRVLRRRARRRAAHRQGESTNSDFAVPDQPVGVPETFREYIELMFDLQVLAFQADITRVSTLMMARENVNRAYPEIGLPEAHHSISHHGNNPEKMKNYAKLNTYHVETLAYFLKKLQETADSDGNLLDQHGRALGQRHERRQRSQQLQRSGGRRGREESAGQGQPALRRTRRARRWPT